MKRIGTIVALLTLVVGASLVMGQQAQGPMWAWIASPTDVSKVASVINSTPTGAEFGLVTRCIGCAAATPSTTGAVIADVTVTNASTQLVASSTTRLSFHCTNTGSVNFRIGIGATPTATSGDQVVPKGSFTTDSTAAVNAVSEGSNTTASCGSESQ